MKHSKFFLLSTTFVLICTISFLNAIQFPSLTKQILELNDDEIAIFNYDASLISQENNDNPHDDSYNKLYIKTKLDGFKRTWSAAQPNIYGVLCTTETNEIFYPLSFLSLNIEHCENSQINGIILVCSKNDLKSYDTIKHNYIRIKINNSLKDITIIGEAYTYIVKPEYYFPTEKLDPNPLNYLATTILSHEITLLHSLKKLDPNFINDFSQNTQPIPFNLVHRFYGYENNQPNPAFLNIKNSLSQEIL